MEFQEVENSKPLIELYEGLDLKEFSSYKIIFYHYLEALYKIDDLEKKLEYITRVMLIMKEDLQVSKSKFDYLTFKDDFIIINMNIIIGKR